MVAAAVVAVATGAAVLVDVASGKTIVGVSSGVVPGTLVSVVLTGEVGVADPAACVAVWPAAAVTVRVVPAAAVDVGLVVAELCGVRTPIGVPSAVTVAPGVLAGMAATGVSSTCSPGSRTTLSGSMP